MKPNRKILKQLIQAIVEKVHPIRIILFGSMARGTAGPDSDIDLMVVMPNGTHRRHTRQKLHRDIPGIGIPLDLLVATLEDFEKYGDHPSLIYKQILDEGKVLYGA